MDLLFKRYADPSSLLDPIIQNGDFLEFIKTIFEKKNEESEWEYFLHRIFDQSFNDFKRSLEPVREMSAQEIGTAIDETEKILNGFVPPERGEELGAV